MRSARTYALKRKLRTLPAPHRLRQAGRTAPTGSTSAAGVAPPGTAPDEPEAPPPPV